MGTKFRCESCKKKKPRNQTVILKADQKPLFICKKCKKKGLRAIEQLQGRLDELQIQGKPLRRLKERIYDEKDRLSALALSHAGLSLLTHRRTPADKKKALELKTQIALRFRHKKEEIERRLKEIDREVSSIRSILSSKYGALYCVKRPKQKRKTKELHLPPGTPLFDAGDGRDFEIESGKIRRSKDSFWDEMDDTEYSKK